MYTSSAGYYGVSVQEREVDNRKTKKNSSEFTSIQQLNRYFQEQLVVEFSVGVQRIKSIAEISRIFPIIVYLSIHNVYHIVLYIPDIFYAFVGTGSYFCVLKVVVA